MQNIITVRIGGLHCASCQTVCSQALSSIRGVTKAEVSASGIGRIFYSGSAPSRKELSEALKGKGYELLEGSSGPSIYLQALAIAAIIGAYWLLGTSDLPDAGSLLGADKFSYGLALITGAVAGISTCLALVGSLVLAASSNYAKNHPDKSGFARFRPNLYFNLGRVGGFLLGGGLLGLAGSALRFSNYFTAGLMLVAGIVVALVGLKLLDIFPGLNTLALPKKLSSRLPLDRPWLLGALTFLLPCGFTQAMQVYALSSGSFLSGAVIMGLFALGTAPGLLGLGGLGSIAARKKIFLRLAGVLILLMALYNINGGFRLFALGNFEAEDNTIASAQSGTVKEIYMEENSRGYEPNRFEVKKGDTVRWIIDAKEPYSCASSLMLPAFGIRRQLRTGQNIIEFTPDKTGSFTFSCSMGMYRGTFNVVE